MFISIIFLAIVAVVFMFAFAYQKAGKIKEERIQEAKKRGDLHEAKRLREMSDDQAADEFEDELYK